MLLSAQLVINLANGAEKDALGGWIGSMGGEKWMDSTGSRIERTYDGVDWGEKGDFKDNPQIWHEQLREWNNGFPSTQRTPGLINGPRAYISSLFSPLHFYYCVNPSLLCCWRPSLRFLYSWIYSPSVWCLDMLPEAYYSVSEVTLVGPHFLQIKPGLVEC